MAKLTMTIVIPDKHLERSKARQLANRPKEDVIPDPYFPDDPEKRITNPNGKAR